MRASNLTSDATTNGSRAINITTRLHVPPIKCTMEQPQDLLFVLFHVPLKGTPVPNTCTITILLHKQMIRVLPETLVITVRRTFGTIWDSQPLNPSPNSDNTSFWFRCTSQITCLSVWKSYVTHWQPTVAINPSL